MKRYKLLLSAMLAAATLLHAQDPLAPTVSRILENNIELKGTSERYRAEILDLRGENVLAGPELDFDFKANSDETRYDITLSQSFDWPGVYSARRKAADIRSNAFNILMSQERTEMTIRIRETLTDCIFAADKIKALEAIRTNIDRIADAYRRGYELREATALDVKKLEIVRFNMDLRLEEARNALERSLIQLRQYNGGNPVALPDVSLHLSPLESRSAYDTGIAGAKARTLLIEASRADALAAKRSLLPGFSIGYLHSYEERRHFNGFTVGINLPSWSGKARKAQYEALTQAAMIENADYSLKRQADIDADYSEAESLYKILNGAKGLTDDSYLQLLSKALEARQINLFTYLTDLGEFLDARFAYLERLHAYNLLLTRLGNPHLATVAVEE